MNNATFVFVYAKDKKIKVLGLEDSKNQEPGLLAEGWKHTQTINACAWLENLHNECTYSAILDEIISLSNPCQIPENMLYNIQK